MYKMLRATSAILAEMYFITSKTNVFISTQFITDIIFMTRDYLQT